MKKKIKITIMIISFLILILLIGSPLVDNKKIHDKVFEEKARIDGTIDKEGKIICDYKVMWMPFGRYAASCEGSYFVAFGRIL